MALRQRFPSIPLIVAGDLNQNRDGARWYGTTEVKAILTAGLDNAELSCATSVDVVRAGLLQEHHPVDRVCVSNGIPATQLTCWEPRSVDQVRMSDHPGVALDTCHDP